MKKNHFIQLLIVAVLFISLGILSCNKYERTVIKEQYLPDEIPDYSSLVTVGTPASNAEIHLGRVLFYEKALSKNNTISCASCHKQEFAFADNKAGSIGFESRVTPRNSIAIQNISQNFFGGFEGQSPLFWDGRKSNLVDLIGKPIANHIEMGMDNPEDLLRKLNEKPYIKSLVNKAYGTNTIDMSQLANAMSQFLFRINTRMSKFDQSFMNGPGTTLSAKELRGQELFNTTYQCNKCHNPSSGPYMGAGFANIGLNAEEGDAGKMGISGSSADRGLFKVPDLHNVAITAPYMHDGRFKTLDEVLNHYSQGILKSSTLDLRLQNEHGEPLRLNITEEDKKLIIAFLESMTDNQMITNPLLSNPFKTK